MRKNKGFTLIELLVVIAIIALLLSIIVPALKKVKKQAATIVCLANVRSMTEAWHSYAMDNDQKMANGHVPRRTDLSMNVPRFWVEAPQTPAGLYTGDKAVNNTELPIAEEQEGIRKGLLFPYLDAVDVYHCPADRSKNIFANHASAAFGSFWNSYSITGMMNAEKCKEAYLLYHPGSTSGWDTNGALRVSELMGPGNKIVFLENADPRGWLMGSFLVNYTTPAWVDPFAIWHGTTKPQSPLGFADGHAENHIWVNKSTYDNAMNGTFTATPPAGEREDIEFMIRGYLPKPVR